MSIFVILFASLISSTFADGVELFLRSSIYVDQADFALKLLRKSGDRSESSILSPFSVSVALAMTYAGAKGNTRKQLNALLANDVEDEEFHNHFFELLKSLKNFENFEDYDDENYRCQLVSSNKLFVRADADILVPFMEIINSKYFGQFEKVDFTKAALVAKEINEWVENQTNSKIRELVNAGMFNSNTFMVLVNAIYFKGSWYEAFEKHLTAKKPFYHTENNVEQVNMMSVMEYFPYYGDDNVEVLGLSYRASPVLMYVFLPRHKNGLGAFEDSINGDILLKLISICSRRRVIVNLPKFKIEKKFELVPTLKELGVTDAFGYAANFSGLTSSSVQISNVIHKAFIDVNEKGTEAAAASSVHEVFMSSFVDPTVPIVFLADHPFMFAIVMDKTVLFIGRYF